MKSERWNLLTEYEQMGNIGSAFFRASKGATSYDEFFELLDLTIGDPKWKGRTKELLLLRNIVKDLMKKTGTYPVSVSQLNDYFLGFGIAARK